LDWAVWYQDIDFAVHKCAFEDEASARAAFDEWSFVRILTRRHVEVGCHGTLLAPVVGAIRETIDLSRPTTLPPPPSTAAAVVAAAGESRPRTSADGEQRPFSVHSSSGPFGSAFDAGQVHPLDDASEWAVWTSEWFEIRRFHFPSEAAAREALEGWHTVRVLSRGEREVAARVRWESLQMSYIRESMDAHRLRLNLP
jgi:hypothetical protein